MASKSIKTKKGCASVITCASTSASCKLSKALPDVDDCARECCKDKDLCNKDFPSLPGSVDRATVGQVAMLGSLLLAMLFV